MKNSFKVSRDVREFMERLKAERKRPPGLYERICHLGHRLFKGITKSMSLEENTIKQLSWAGYRLTPSEWWSGFLFLLLTPIILAIAGFIASIALGAWLLSIWYLPVLGFTLGGLLSTAFYYYPASAASVQKTEAQSKAIETAMLLSFALYHRSDLQNLARKPTNFSGGMNGIDI